MSLLLPLYLPFDFALSPVLITSAPLSQLMDLSSFLLRSDATKSDFSFFFVIHIFFISGILSIFVIIVMVIDIITSLAVNVFTVSVNITAVIFFVDIMVFDFYFGLTVKVRASLICTCITVFTFVVITFTMNVYVCVDAVDIVNNLIGMYNFDGIRIINTSIITVAWSSGVGRDDIIMVSITVVCRIAAGKQICMRLILAWE